MTAEILYLNLHTHFMDIEELEIYASISQHFERIIETITLKGEEMPENVKEYSNLRNSSKYQDVTYKKITKKFINNPINRTEENCYEIVNYLGKLSFPLERSIEVEKVSAGVLKFIEINSPRSKYLLKSKDLNWKYPLIIKLKCKLIDRNLIEGKYPFSESQHTKLEENIKHFFNQLGVKILEDEENERAVDHRIIKWSDITLCNGKIYFHFDQKLTVVHCKESNAHLQQLKQILFRKSPSGLKINLHPPYKILEPEIFADVIEFLEVNYRLSNAVLSIPEFQQKINETQGLQQILRTIFSKDSYLDFLIQRQDLSLPVIPVIELNNQIDEPSYIFTIRHRSSYKIVWENKLFGRATYLFKANSKNYKVLLQNIYDYIKADLLLKRKGIIDYEQQLKSSGKELWFIGKINHSSFDGWCINLLEKINQF